LVDHGADVNAKNEAGQTPLHQAARANKFDVAKVSNVMLNLVRQYF